MMDSGLLNLNDDIKEALNTNKPLVALESTLISHGLPYPQNFEVAQSSINEIKKTGSIPVIIGIIEGKIKVGLDKEDIKIFSKSKNIEKVSIHNLALSLSNKKYAATTVASTIYIASKIGIKFFATGGIGGVHLEAEKTFDISSDLNELSKSTMFIVCSGAKSILDLDKTYEKLETLGIPRIGFNTDFMPGFWYFQTDRKVDYNFTDIYELINYLHTCEQIKQKGSVLIFNPIEKDKAIDKSKINLWINESLKKAKLNKIYGKDLTPFLIKEINTCSQNLSLKSNMDLIINNAKLAGKLAVTYKKLV